MGEIYDVNYSNRGWVLIGFDKFLIEVIDLSSWINATEIFKLYLEVF